MLCMKLRPNRINSGWVVEDRLKHSELGIIITTVKRIHVFHQWTRQFNYLPSLQVLPHRNGRLRDYGVAERARNKPWDA